MAEMGLYGYQEEVVQRALRGENLIIWLPTGGGKTRAAVYVAKRHLQNRPKAKVVVLVNMMHLVDQHYTNEFFPHLGQEYRVIPVTGDSEEKDFFGKVLREWDVVICTAQLLHNAMNDTEEDRHVELSDITLLIIDECHHTNKDHVYRKIMRSYVEKKLKDEWPLPQILGLTASPGTGGKKMLETAVEHVLTICANMDSAIVSTKNYIPELKEKVPRPRKSFDITDPRPHDPLGDHLKWMMRQIHEFMDLPRGVRLRECGTQEYEADVVELEKTGVQDNNRVMAQCALHLRQYNDALLINDTLRMIDAYNSLKDFYFNKRLTIDGTDIFLVGLFEENQMELSGFTGDLSCENPKMAKLQSTLLSQFGPNRGSRGILFSKTRKSVNCLHDWIVNNHVLQRAGVKAAILIGAGNGASHMTQNEQGDTIRDFRRGALNLLISTTIAEEGLDIPECNFVVRYGLLTNEIAQQQASGRARASDSVYSVVAQRGGRELRRELTNEYLEELTGKAINKVQEMSTYEFRQKIIAIQREEIIRRTIADKINNEKRNQFSAANIQLLCRNCFKPVAFASDIKLVEGQHHVNINPEFKREYSVGGKVHLERHFEDWEPGCKINCNNGDCNKEWGFELKYKDVALLANLKITNFALLTPEGRKTVKKWKDVPFPVDEFNFTKYCQDHYPNLLI